jgi:hypothetical protein
METEPLAKPAVWVIVIGGDVMELLSIPNCAGPVEFSGIFEKNTILTF